jgi:4-hydroxybenzoate polyprenyltransferase
LERSDIDVPIIVDLDGTLVRTDLLVESFFVLLASRPAVAIAALTEIRNGLAALKSKLADAAIVEIKTLPLNQEIIAFLNAEKAKGRRIYLASASDHRYVERVADHLGLFNGVVVYDAGASLTKADRLCEVFGEHRFDYIGDASVDEAVWRRARCIYIANASSAHLVAVRTWAPEAQALGTQTCPWRDYICALRAHQWLKNILVFAPALAAHRFGNALLASFLAFISFCLCASSAYILNDLLDLRNDRAHPSKRLRPFAAGRIPIVHGLVLFPVLLLGSLIIGLFLPVEFLFVLGGYIFLTCAYSWDLKRRMLVDAVALACLYGSRLAAGGAAAGVPLSPWLVAFATFLFFSLALVKRCAELGDHLEKGKGDPMGRGYYLDDLPVLQSMATASGYLSVLVLALYINGDAVGALYGHPDRLWLNCVLLLFWVSRMIMVTHRGQMHDDPLIFAAADRISQLIVLGCAIVTLSAII